jgi:hypothetical protein
LTILLELIALLEIVADPMKHARDGAEAGPDRYAISGVVNLISDHSA